MSVRLLQAMGGASYRVDARLALEHAENGRFEVVDGERLAISFDSRRPSLLQRKEDQGQLPF
jgi:hypothetical protein